MEWYYTYCPGKMAYFVGYIFEEYVTVMYIYFQSPKALLGLHDHVLSMHRHLRPHRTPAPNSGPWDSNCSCNRRDNCSSACGIIEIRSKRTYRNLHTTRPKRPSESLPLSYMQVATSHSYQYAFVKVSVDPGTFRTAWSRRRKSEHATGRYKATHEWQRSRAM
jgi:hypothetical protein